jgi:hypothetical protein
MKIQIVIPKHVKTWIYPIFRWRKEFQSKGILFDVFSEPDFGKKGIPDIVILTSRYYQNKFRNIKDYLKGFGDYAEKDIKHFQGLGCKVVFYDLSDASGSRELFLLKYVDLFLKRQIIKDKNFYAQPGSVKYRIWDENDMFNLDPCDLDDLNKLDIGWNLGYNLFDFTFWQLNRLGINFYKTPVYEDPNNQRSITCSYRGKSDGSRMMQRQQVMDILKKMDGEQFVTGPVIGKSKYLKEMAISKAVVSPFGYGEICYRDIECFIKGSILLKPNLDHLDTFPRIFVENETYIPLNWDLSNLRDMLLTIDNNYNNYQQIAITGQNRYKELYNSFPMFYEHFRNTVCKIVEM